MRAAEAASVVPAPPVTSLPEKVSFKDVASTERIYMEFEGRFFGSTWGKRGLLPFCFFFPVEVRS